MNMVYEDNGLEYYMKFKQAERHLATVTRALADCQRELDITRARLEVCTHAMERDAAGGDDDADARG